MRAEHCYTTSLDEKTISLLLMSQARYEKERSLLSNVELNGLASQQFTGNLGDIAIINDSEGNIHKVYIGAGENVADAVALAHVATSLPKGNYLAKEPLSPAALVSWSLAQYQFDRYKTSKIAPKILVLKEQELHEILAEANAVFLVRDLINMPANELGPKELADTVATMANQHGAEFKQWIGDELLDENFPAIHAVGRAAAPSAAPRLISMIWGEAHHPRITLVGKGVCFDTGGLDIKPSSGMRLMKKDMGGAAQVIGLAEWIMTHQIPIRLHVLIPAVENAIDGQAYRPGDVLTMRNGLHVEIHNTDAEGRLVLADALVKACEEKPELIIDFATLTGAARIAVGTEIAAMFVNNDELAGVISESAQIMNDPVWRMPLFAGYSDMFSSKIADFSNATDSSYGGAITAALFLQRFVSADINWVHLDIMAWNIGNKPGKPEGGEAMGMRAVGHYLRAKYS